MDECLFPLSYEYVSIDETSPWLISGKFSNNSLKEIEDAIIYSAPCYLTDTGNEIAITHQFMIKLKKSSDYQILLDFAQQNNAVIIMRNNIPLWYTLSCSEHSSENALQLAIRAYESGLFSYANACFLEDSTPITSYVSYNDPLYSYQWYLNHSSGYDINFSDTHLITRGTASTKVAVVDQGFQINHPELNIGFSWDATREDVPARQYGNLGRHGTSVAGIIGASVNNSRGIVGIAPLTTLLPISVDINVNLNQSNAKSFITAFGDAIDYANYSGASVISNSWSVGSMDYSLYIKDAVENAILQGRNGKGCVVVFASGNGGSDVLAQPMSNVEDILCVGSIDSTGIKATSSSFGSLLDIVAPGEDILSLDHQSSYGSFSGTSMACPIASGVAALILSKNPNLTQQQVVEIMTRTATKLPEYTFNSSSDKPYGTWNPAVGYGLLNSFDAVSLAAGYYNLIEFDYLGTEVEMSLTSSKDIVIIWDIATQEQEIVSGTNTATTISHTFTTSGTHRICIAERVDPLNSIPAYSTALLKFDLVSGEHAYNIRINSSNQQLRYIRIIGGSEFRKQVIRINNLTSLQSLYLIQCRGADAIIANCPNLSNFATSRSIWMHPSVTATDNSIPDEQFDPRIVIGDQPIPPTWPDIPESIPSLRSLRILRCPSLQIISLENTEINNFDFSNLSGLRYLYLSSHSNNIVSGSNNLLNISTQGEYLAASLETLPPRATGAAGYVILRCIDASSISYIPITIHNNYANRIENHLTDNNWNPIWESNLIVMQ